MSMAGPALAPPEAEGRPRSAVDRLRRTVDPGTTKTVPGVRYACCSTVRGSLDARIGNACDYNPVLATMTRTSVRTSSARLLYADGRWYELAKVDFGCIKAGQGRSARCKWIYAYPMHCTARTTSSYSKARRSTSNWHAARCCRDRRPRGRAGSGPPDIEGRNFEIADFAAALGPGSHRCLRFYGFGCGTATRTRSKRRSDALRAGYTRPLVNANGERRAL